MAGARLGGDACGAFALLLAAASLQLGLRAQHKR
jgi:hypothetical protein